MSKNITKLRKLLKQHDIKLSVVTREWETGIYKHTVLKHSSCLSYASTIAPTVPDWVKTLHALAQGEHRDLFLAAIEDLRDFPKQKVVGCLMLLLKNTAAKEEA